MRDATSPPWRLAGLAFATACLMMLAGNVSATVWHVDASLGSDNADGKSATLSGIRGPFRSLAKLANSLKPGDTALLACGSTWHEHLTVVGGTPSAPIIIAASGKCAASKRPTIDPRQALIVPASNSYSETGVPIAAVGAVYVGDKLLAPAFLGGTPWRKLPKQSDTAKMAALVALPEDVLAKGSYLKGTVIAIRTVPYRVERRRIIEVLKGEGVRLESPTHYPYKDNTPFFIEQIADSTSSPGWAISSGGKLTLLNTTVEKSKSVSWVRSQPTVLSNGTLHLRGIAIQRSGEDALRIVRGAGSTLEDILISGAVRDGVYFVESENSSISNSFIRDVGRDAIRLEKSGHSSVLNNEIEGVGMGELPTDTFAAINAETSSSMRIRGNRLRSIAYLGIRFKRNTIVEENLLDGVCLRLADCGAIYGWARLDPLPAFASRLSRNIIRNVGSMESPEILGNPIATGIYLDDLSSGVTVEENVIDNAANGIFLHNSTMHIVRNNVVLATRDCSICLVGGINVETTTAMGNNLFKGNQLAPAPGGSAYRMFNRYGMPEWQRISGDRIFPYQHSPVFLSSTSDRLTRLIGKRPENFSRLLDDGALTIHPYTISLAARGTALPTTGGFGVSGESAKLMPASVCSDTRSCGKIASQATGSVRLYSGEFDAQHSAPLVIEVAVHSELTGNAKMEIRASEAPYDVLADLGSLQFDPTPTKILIPIPDVPFRKRWRVHFVADSPANFEVSNFQVQKGAIVSSSLKTHVNATSKAKKMTCADWGLADCSALRTPSGEPAEFAIVPPFSAIIAERAATR